MKFSKMQKIILAAICTFGVGATLDLPKAQAVYESKSDTGTSIFDYLENQRRERRANALTDEQKQLIADIAEAKNNLPHPMEEGDPVPVAFEGDDLTYNTLTGEFTAKGNVDIIQLEGYRFQSPSISGNVETQDVRVSGKAHLMQVRPDAPRVTLDGYNTVYNYGTKEGTMERAKGKVGEYYVSGKRFEFYPDHIVAYDAYQTKCGAKSPDYRVSAKRMEIWPEQIVRMYDVKLMIGDAVVGSRKYMERKLEEGDENYFPRFGYNSASGAYVEDTFKIPVFNPHYNFIVNAHIETKKGVRSSSEFVYGNRMIAVRALYGYYYDSDGRWIKKEPSFDVLFRKHLDNSPITYSLEYEIGRWSYEDRASTHQEIAFNVAHDPIDLGKNYTLFLAVGYKITKDKVKRPIEGDLDVRGLNYNIRLLKEFNDRIATYVGFEYSKNTSQNSLYEFDTDAYSNRFSTGISYRLTDKDRLVIGLKFDTKSGNLADADYYWYRDLHCSTAVIRWRQKRHKVEARWQFTPW